MMVFGPDLIKGRNEMIGAELRNFWIVVGVLSVALIGSGVAVAKATDNAETYWNSRWRWPPSRRPRRSGSDTLFSGLAVSNPLFIGVDDVTVPGSSATSSPTPGSMPSSAPKCGVRPTTTSTTGFCSTTAPSSTSGRSVVPSPCSARSPIQPVRRSPWWASRSTAARCMESRTSPTRPYTRST